MSPLRCSQILILLLIDGLRHVKLVGSEDPICPRSLYDCKSLENKLKDTIDVAITPDFIVHMFDYPNIADLCRFLQTPSCSEPVLGQCKGEIVYAARTFKSRQQYICTSSLTKKDMVHFKKCMGQWSRHFHTCHQKRADKLGEISYLTHSSSAADQPWCNITTDYINCVYSVMALGCTIDVGNEYIKIVNQSMPVVEAVFGYGCSMNHPMDIFKSTTPPPQTTSSHLNRVAGVYSYGRRPTRQSSHSSAFISSCANIFLIVLCSVLSNVLINTNVVLRVNVS